MKTKEEYDLYRREWKRKKRRVEGIEKRGEKKFCKNGHPRTPENLKGKSKSCKICHREQELARNRSKGIFPHKKVCRKGHDLNQEENRRPGRSDCAICHRDSQKRRYHENPQRHRKAARRWQKENRKSATKRQREWKRRNPERVRELTLRRRYRYDSQCIEYASICTCDLRCSYCASKPVEEIDHIDPVSGAGRNTWDNLAGSCRSCNASKKDRPLLQFLLIR